MNEINMPYKKESDWVPVNVFPWGGNYRPDTRVKISRDDDAFHVIMKSYETELRIVQTQRNSPVCTDSCMEIFFNATPLISTTYMNIEANPGGIMLIGYSNTGDRQGSHTVLAPDNSYFKMKSTIASNYWQIDFIIPYEFIKEFFASFDIKETKYITGNFYKCGDLTAFPHYGVWNNIETELPDYHRPEYFGKINLI